MTRPVRVLVCDRLPVLRDGLRAVLTAAGDLDVIATTGDGQQALALAGRLRPDVVVTDVALAGLSGVELTRRLTAAGGPRVLVFALHDDDGTVLDALEAGATGFVVKGASGEQLLAAVRVVAAGQAALEPGLTRRVLDWSFRRDRRPDRRLQPALGGLTPRELEVLQLVAAGLSTPEIAEELSLGVATVRSHTYHLRCKLHLKDRAQVVSFAYRSGVATAGR